MKNVRKYVKIAVLCGAFIYCLVNTRSVSAAVAGAAGRCLNIIIPSLFAMMAVSQMMIKSGVTSIIPRFAGKIGRFFLGMEGNILPVFTFGMFAGYPVGAKMLCTEYDSGRLTKKRAELLCGLCYGAGPAFIFGCISGQLYGSAAAGQVILISTVAANFILAVAVSPLLRRANAPTGGGSCPVRLDAALLTQCTLSASRSMADICSSVLIFSVFTVMLGKCGVLAAIGAAASSLTGLSADICRLLTAALLDITNVGGLPCGDYTLLPYLSALTSFGGLCVIFQIAAVTSGKLSVKPLVAMRLAASVLSFIICRVISPFLLRGEAVSAAAVKVRAHENASAVPSVMLIIMTLMLFREFRANSNS